MLVLTRKINQQIRLGEDITITVLRVQGNSIRIGVDAPRNVRVLRGELEPHGQASPENSGTTDNAGPTEKMETLEFDLRDLLGDTPAAEQATDEEAAEPQVYQMRTSAPLSRFVRTPADAVVSSMVMQ